jgi:hypothetical protein
MKRHPSRLHGVARTGTTPSRESRSRGRRGRDLVPVAFSAQWLGVERGATGSVERHLDLFVAAALSEDDRAIL